MINQCVRYTLGIGEFSGHYEELFVLISTTGDCFVLFFFCRRGEFSPVTLEQFSIESRKFLGAVLVLRLFLNQSDLKTEAGRELATSVFLRFQQFAVLIVSSHLAMRT